MPLEFDIGFLGGGQLARMSIQAAQRMGLKCLSLDPAQDSPASQIAPSIAGSLSDPEAIRKVVTSCRSITLENEFIPAASIREAFSGEDEAKLTPGVECLATIQDKLLQRQAYERAGVPSPRAVAYSAGVEFPLPAVLKARFGGYDGKGTRTVRTQADLDVHRDLWEGGGWLIEAFVPFVRELAVMVVRSPDATICFPTMETIQTDHVCDLVFPAHADAADVSIAAVEAVGGFGLFGVELFELEDGSCMVNEIAPRPHNTGHYTLDWCGPSQFEQHVRLTMGLPPVPLDGDWHGPTVCMANLLGQSGAKDYREGLRAACHEPEIFVHWYGKAESKPGRKMGHLNAVGDDAVERAVRARARFYSGWTA